MKNLFYYHTRIGKIAIAEENNKITNLFLNCDLPFHKYTVTETSMIKEAGIQLNEYLSGKRKMFDLPLDPQGTEFMKKVWDCLRKIPYGSTKSYKEIAAESGNVKACRAVGQANNKNPIPIFIPCHRVIGSTGNPVGYRYGVDLKLRLLELEKKPEK